MIEIIGTILMGLGTAMFIGSLFRAMPRGKRANVLAVLSVIVVYLGFIIYAIGVSHD